MSFESQNKSAAEHLAIQLRDWANEQLAGQNSTNNPKIKIPSIRKIATDYNTSVTTAMYALRLLEDEGLVQRRPHGTAFLNSTQGQQEQATAPTRQARQIAVAGPIGPRSEYAWKDLWSIRIMLSAEQALLEKSSYLPARVGVYGPDWPEAMQQIGEQIKSLSSNLAGVIIPGANNEHHQHLFDVCDQLDLPWVCVNRPKYQRTSNFISLDYQLCGKIAGAAFQELEAPRILILARDLNSTSDSEKAFGLFQSYWNAGKQTERIHTISCGGIREIDGYTALQKYLNSNPPPDAIFATGDLLAMGAIKYCQKQGLSVPDDIKVLSSTGLDVAEFALPPLATISQPMRKMGESAAMLLLKMIESGERDVPGQMIAPTLIPRQSLGLSEPQAQKIAGELGIALGEADETTSALDDQLPRNNVGQVLACQDKANYETTLAG